MLTPSNSFSRITPVKLTLHAELTMIVSIVMLVVGMHTNLDMLDSMSCVHQEATMSQEIGTQNGWASISDASMKMVQ